MSFLHPTRASHARSHEPTFKAVVRRLSDAVNRANTSEKNYDAVSVVSLRWSNDDLELERSERDLLHTFREVYNFSTQSFCIPHNHPNPTSQVFQWLLPIIDNKHFKSSLLILVYEGHAERSGPNQENLSLFESMTAGAPRISWTAIDGILQASLGDVWVILDCCAATTAAIRSSEQEFLVASVFESAATVNIITSFTSRLIAILNSCAKFEITVAQIHARLIAEATDSDSSLEYIPVYVAPATKSSIVLRPFKKISQELQEIKMGDTRSDGKVLISVSLQGKHALPDYRQWERWLANNIPNDMANIKIQAVFDSSSTYCLLTVPVEVWDLLRDHDAYSFVQFLNSDNKYFPQPPQSERHQSSTGPKSDFSGLGEGFAGDIPRRAYGGGKESR